MFVSNLVGIFPDPAANALAESLFLLKKHSWVNIE